MARTPGSRSLAVVTSHDYDVTMKKAREKSVRVAALKARLSEYLRTVKRGHPVVVYDRETPVARLVPYEAGREALRVRERTRSLREVELPGPLAQPIDSLQALLDERQSRR